MQLSLLFRGKRVAVPLHAHPPLYYKVWLIMRLIVVFLTAACLQVSARSLGQTVTLHESNTALEKVLKQIKKQTGHSFYVANVDLLKNAKPVNVRLKNMPLTQALRTIFQDQHLTFKIIDSVIAIKASEPESAIEDWAASLTAPKDSMVLVKGRVTDEKGAPLAGVGIVVKNGNAGTATAADGTFQLRVKDNAELVISSVGYQPQQLNVWRGSKNIALIPAQSDLGNLVISTGMFNRNKQTFTGAVASFTGAELKQIGNLNVIQSLKTLDPSFIVVNDNTLGSNPNQLPKIEVRGKTSLTSSSVRDQFSSDPNQPLIILNGMETTLQQIVDLDINRIASITLLKDAASTALYGSRAANGVLVVETIRPKGGELTVAYTADLRLEVPDLSDYNMMDAAENLEFQRLAGLYNSPLGTSTINNTNLYNQRLREVKRGVNSYWLNTPLRNSFTNGHSLRINGGSQEFQYGVALNYRTLNGVMLGSRKNTWGGTVDLSYRKNKLNVTNQVYINGTLSDESPYGSFADYVRLNPYYRKQNEDGSLNRNKYLEEYFVYGNAARGDTIRIGNPLYNASLNAKNNTTSTLIQNNLAFIWDMAPGFRFSGGLQVQKSLSDYVLFTPSGNTRFDRVDVYRKGQYTSRHTNGFNYQGNLMLTYNKVFNSIHSITGNIRGELQEQKLVTEGFEAVGFPEGVNPNPSFAYSFAPDANPYYATAKIRRNNALGSFNYAYDNRYYVDLSYRLDGSTSFGSENKYSSFWSAGVGWTLSREHFFRNARWLTLLRVRANIGTSGNQALGSFASASIFGYENNINFFGQGLYLNQLGNPGLKWQKTRSTSLGADVVLMNNRLSLTLNAYEKYSNPLITDGTVPLSMGISELALNIGSLRTRGMEAIFRFSPLYKPNENMVWTLGFTGSFYKSRYEGFSNMLKNLNEEAQSSNSLQRYLDGYSPDELWAVRSLGIDPATGQEVFSKKNGEKTLVYSAEDIVPSGNGRPVAEGIISSNLNFKGFLLGVNLRYSLGARVFNTALYNKVENISFNALQYNQDRRALDLRWRNPGDQAQFKSIAVGAYTPMSSRFIQKENFLAGESINAGYEFRSVQHRWLTALGAKSLRVNAYMNDIFRWSTVKAERGIDYPFSNAVSLSINLFF